MQQKFFSITKEKAYITLIFFLLRMVLGYLGKMGAAAKMPFVISMIITAIDFVISLPMKIFMATPSLKAQLQNQAIVLLLFITMIAYWYLFACTLMHSYKMLSEQSTSPKEKHITIYHAKAESEEKDNQTKL